MLNDIDTNLKNETGKVALEDKVDILSSLTEIIKLMGSDFVASVKHKLLSTLNSGKIGKNSLNDIFLFCNFSIMSCLKCNCFTIIIVYIEKASNLNSECDIMISVLAFKSLPSD